MGSDKVFSIHKKLELQGINETMPTNQAKLYKARNSDICFFMQFLTTTTKIVFSGRENEYQAIPLPLFEIFP